MEAFEGCKKNKVLVFDFGGVIVNPDKAHFYQFIQQIFKLEDQTLNTVRERFQAARKAQMREHAFWIQLAKELNVSLPQDWTEIYNSTVLRALNENKKLRHLIKFYKEQGFKIGLLSNVNIQHAELLKKNGFYEDFSPLLLSCEIGIDKPDPRAYHILLNHLQVAPEDCIFIDDKLCNIEAAKALKIDAIHFLNAEQIQEELERRLKH